MFGLLCYESLGLKHTSTNSPVLHSLVPSFAHAASDGYHPLSVSIAVQLNGHIHLLCVRDADTSCGHQGGALCSWECLLEQRPVRDDTRALPVKDTNGDEGHTATVVLESQVEAVSWHGAEAPDFGVDLHHSTTEVHLGEALVCCYGVNFDPGVLHPSWGVSGGCVGIRFIIIEVKRLFTGARHVRNATAVPHRELHLHVDPLSTTTPDVLCPYPVVLIVVENIADLVRPDGVHVFIITAHLLPLWAKDRQTFLHLNTEHKTKSATEENSSVIHSIKFNSAVKK